MDVITHVNRTLGSFAESITGHAGAVSGLYEGVDLATLSTAEKLWVQWYEYWGNPVIATGVMSFVLHEVGRTTHPDCVFRAFAPMGGY